MSETKQIEGTYTDAAVGKLSRNITTRFFASKGEIRQLDRSKPAVHWFGEIVGVVYASNEKKTQQTNAAGAMGDVLTSYQLVGEFEATKYSTGEVAEAGSCYLPNYFAEVIHATINNPNSPITNMAFAVEVGMEVLPDDKVRGAIDVAWTVRHKARVGQAESPLAAIKRAMIANGVPTRLPPPKSAPRLIEVEASIPGDTGAADDEVHPRDGDVKVKGKAKAA